MRLGLASALALGALLAATDARAGEPFDRDGVLETALGVGTLANGAATATRERGSSYYRQGAGISGELLVGGRVLPRFYVGGAITAVVLPPAPHLQGSATLDLVIVGPAVSYWFFRGFHAELAAGAATFADASTDLLPTGTGFSLGLGWETMLHDRWGIGVLGRTDYAALEIRTNDAVEQHRVLTGSLLISTTCHFE